MNDLDDVGPARVAEAEGPHLERLSQGFEPQRLDQCRQPT